MPTKKGKSDGKLQIGGSVHVTGGDFVAGDKNTNVNKGGVYVGGDVQGSNIVTGDQNQVGNEGTIREELFSELNKKIELRPNTPPEDRADLKTSVAEIRAEAEKGDQADESFLAQRIRNIKRIATDIAEVVLAALTNPAAGFAAVVTKIAQRAQKSAQT